MGLSIYQLFLFTFSFLPFFSDVFFHLEPHFRLSLCYDKIALTHCWNANGWAFQTMSEGNRRWN